MNGVSLESAKAAQEMAQTVGLSPSVQMFLVIACLVIALAAPFAFLLRDWRSKGKLDEIEGKQGDIQVGLYNHLSEQVTLLTKRYDQLQGDYNTMVKENAELKGRLSQLEKSEETVKRLQAKLDDKDATIIARDTQINQMFSEVRLRDQKIIDLQDRISQLELRLARDEKEFCRNCKLREAADLAEASNPGQIPLGFTAPNDGGTSREGGPHCGPDWLGVGRLRG